MNERIGKDPADNVRSMAEWLDNTAESATPIAGEPIDVEAPMDAFDSIEDVTMGALQSIGNHLRSEQLTGRKAAQHDVKVQRRIWQLEDDAAATGSPVPERASLHPMGPKPKSRWGRILHSLNTPT